VPRNGTVPTELIFILVSAIVGVLLAVGAAIAFARERAETGRHAAALDESPTGREPLDKYLIDGTESVGDAANGTNERMLRILWWVTIAAVLVGVGLSDSYRSDQATIYGLGGVAALAAVTLHEILPRRWRTSLTRGIEVAIALALASGLLLLTGYASSPYTFSFDLVAVAVALARGGWPTIVVVVVATLAYGGVVAADPAFGRFDPSDLLRIGLNVGSLWLLAALAGVFAAHERATRSRLTRLWRIDPLTGLFNRGQIYSDLEQEVLRSRRSGRPFSLLMLDLDGLKTVNDSLGHQRGDNVLQALGRVIRDKTRSVDSAYRYGGDEFLVLLPETEYAGAYVVAEKIRAEVEEVGRRLEAEGSQASVSIGLVSYPEDGSTPDELVRAADRAMYNAKALGKNQISGFPRPPRPAALRVTPGDEEPGGSGGRPLRELTSPQAARPREPAAGFGDVAAAAARVVQRGPTAETGGDDEPDAAEMRRTIAAATRSFDPDHHIDRALDVFLSPRVPGPESPRPS
jgi:diguanylate cyclase (GGDEF)-like protein